MSISHKKITKILLILPPRKSCGIELISGGFHPPYAFMTLATALSNKSINIQIIDCPAQNINKDKLLKIIHKEKPDLIGLTCLTYYSNDTLQLAKEIKQSCTTIIVGGGTHLSYEFKKALKSGFDYICRFSAEESFIKLIEYLNKGGIVADIPSLAYIDNGDVYLTQKFSRNSSISSFELNEWDSILKNNYWWWFKSPGNVSLNTSRGCKRKCKFCILPRYWGEYTRLDLPKLTKTIQILYEKFDKRYFWFTDDDFLTDVAYFEEFCEWIKRQKIDIKWFFQTRCDRIIAHRETIEKAKKAGAFFVLLGAETYSNERLLTFGKQLSVEDVIEANEILNQYKYLIWNSYIVGLGGDGEGEFLKTLNYAKKLRSPIATFTPITPIPGTELWERHKEILDSSKVTMYDAVLPTRTYNVRELEKVVLNMYLCYYLDPKIIRRFFESPKLHRRIVSNFYTKGGWIAFKRFLKFFASPLSACRFKPKQA